MASVENGRRNRGIPKELAEFSFQSTNPHTEKLRIFSKELQLPNSHWNLANYPFQSAPNSSPSLWFSTMKEIIIIPPFRSAEPANSPN